jgi:hypothetical protein
MSVMTRSAVLVLHVGFRAIIGATPTQRGAGAGSTGVSMSNSKSNAKQRFRAAFQLN